MSLNYTPMFSVLFKIFVISSYAPSLLFLFRSKMNMLLAHLGTVLRLLAMLVLKLWLELKELIAQQTRILAYIVLKLFTLMNLTPQSQCTT